MEYYKEDKVTEYVIDRNREYSEVLMSNEEVHIYGESLLQSDEEIIVKGMNESVVVKVADENITRMSYNDYGNTTQREVGHGYNGEMLDVSGLIYLRARYYDPSIARFVQIDTKYEGEKESVVSQNRYAYTLNNPYKYVDRDGEKSVFSVVKGLGESVVDYTKNITYISKIKKTVDAGLDVVSNIFKPTPPPTSLPSIRDIGNNMVNAITKAYEQVKPPMKKVQVVAKCPEPSKSSSREVSNYFDYSIPLPSININYGVFVLQIGKEVLSRFKMTTEEANQFVDAGLTVNHKFDLDFGLAIDNIKIILGNFGCSFSVGSWGSLNYGLNTSIKTTSFAVGYTAQTINIFANDSVELSVTN